MVIEMRGNYCLRNKGNYCFRNEGKLWYYK